MTTPIFSQTVNVVYEFPTMNPNPGREFHYDDASETILFQTAHSTLYPLSAAGLDTALGFSFNGRITEITSFNNWIWIAGNFFGASQIRSELSFDEGNIYLFTGEEWFAPFPKMGVLDNQFVVNDTLFIHGNFDNLNGNVHQGFAFYDFQTTHFQPYFVENTFSIQKLGTNGKNWFIIDFENNQNELKQRIGNRFQTIDLPVEIASVIDLHVIGDSVFVAGEMYGEAGEKYFGGMVYNQTFTPILTSGPIFGMQWFQNRLWMMGDFSDFPKTRLAYLEDGNIIFPREQPDNDVFKFEKGGDGLWLLGSFNAIGEIRTYNRAFLDSNLQWNADTLQNTIGHSPIVWSESYHAGTSDGFYISSWHSQSILTYQNGDYTTTDHSSLGFVNKVMTNTNDEMYIFATTPQSYFPYLFKKEGEEWISQFSYDGSSLSGWNISEVKVREDGKIFMGSRGDDDYFGFFENGQFTSLSGLATTRNEYDTYVRIDDFIFMGEETFVVGFFDKVGQINVNAPIAALRNGEFEAISAPPGLGSAEVSSDYNYNRLFRLNNTLLLWMYPRFIRMNEFSGSTESKIDIYNTSTRKWIETPPFSGTVEEAFIQDGWLVVIGGFWMNDGQSYNAIAWDGQQMLPFSFGNGIGYPQSAVRNGKGEILIQSYDNENRIFFGQVVKVLIATLDLPPASGTLFAQKSIPESVEVESRIFPNPFNPTTNLQFSLNQSQDITVEIFSLTGQRIATIANQRNFSAGTHQLGIDASAWSSGTYIYKISGDFGVNTGKMVVVK